MKKNTQAGFTLVELMVVVGIIGILIALVAPNLTSFTAKAKQSAAKVELAGLYTAEKSFQAEYNTYHGYLDYIGHIPDGCASSAGVPAKACMAGSKRNYAVGFASAGIVAAVTGAAVSGTPIIQYDNTVGTALTVSGNATTTQNTFVARAVGSIAKGNDVWTMTESKILTNNSKDF